MGNGTSHGCALVTGASGGMGAAICRALIADGRRVILADREAEPVRALARELGEQTHALVLDITDAAAVADLPAIVPNAFGPIDVLINNAGHDIGGRLRFDVGSMEDWAAIVETNLVGTLRVTRAVLPGMVERDRGDIVMMSSINALRIIPDMAAYSTSKTGLHAFTETLRGACRHRDPRHRDQSGPDQDRHHPPPLSRRHRQGAGLFRPVQAGAGARGHRALDHVRAVPTGACPGRADGRPADQPVVRELNNSKKAAP
jgi:NADP-dependent 3-hydroxy acid dehydrogenase YdfG